eukprot:326498-Rhodomonas_salina.3
MLSSSGGSSVSDPEDPRANESKDRWPLSKHGWRLLHGSSSVDFLRNDFWLLKCSSSNDKDFLRIECWRCIGRNVSGSSDCLRLSAGWSSWLPLRRANVLLTCRSSSCRLSFLRALCSFT